MNKTRRAILTNVVIALTDLQDKVASARDEEEETKASGVLDEVLSEAKKVVIAK